MDFSDGVTSRVDADVQASSQQQQSRPVSLEFSGASSDRAMPLSPTGYQQPPTPDFPPPSPATAQAGIQHKIDPIIAHVSCKGL